MLGIRPLAVGNRSGVSKPDVTPAKPSMLLCKQCLVVRGVSCVQDCTLFLSLSLFHSRRLTVAQILLLRCPPSLTYAGHYAEPTNIERNRLSLAAAVLLCQADTDVSSGDLLGLQRQYLHTTCKHNKSPGQTVQSLY